MGGKGSKNAAKQEQTDKESSPTNKDTPPSPASVEKGKENTVSVETSLVNDEMFVVGDHVNTAYGTGVVSAIRSDGMLVVRPDTWKLDRDHVPTFYLNANTVHKSAVTLHSFNIGDYVNTPYGTGHVTEVRRDGMIVVRPNLWKVAGDHKPFFYMNATGVTRATNAGTANKITVGDYVDCMYGTGFVAEVRRDNMLVVKPDTWRLAEKHVPTFYIWGPSAHKTVISHVVAVGDVANTPYGVGVVTELRGDGMVVVRPETWEVTGGHKPFFYMQSSQVSKATNSHGNRYLH